MFITKTLEYLTLIFWRSCNEWQNPKIHLGYDLLNCQANKDLLTA